jgi:hypothetical protein
VSRSVDPLAGREIILEWREYGDVLRVTAIDAETGHEAAAAGPRTAARADLERLALNMLTRKLFGEPPAPDAPPEEGAPGRGRLV